MIAYEVGIYIEIVWEKMGLRSREICSVKMKVVAGVY